MQRDGLKPILRWLTPTMKIKRNVIEARYLPFAEGWQELGQKVIWEE